MTTHDSISNHTKDSLLALVAATDEAAAAIAEDYRAALNARELSPDEQNWEVGLDLAAYRAAAIIYEAGSPTPTDVQSAIESYVDHISEAGQQEWLATSEMHKHMTRALLERGLHLAKKDTQFAYGPHIDGRAHEQLDGPNATYNKFGTLITATS